MKRENGYWIDENGNKWYDKKFTEEEAVRLSSALVNCTDCINCTDCTDCTDCTNCRYCRYCTDCTDCRYCTNCTNCTDCTDCRYNPESIISAKIGSRKGQTKVYFYEGRISVICGCFAGNLMEFEAQVIKTHAEGSVFRKEYMDFIEKVKTYFGI